MMCRIFLLSNIHSKFSEQNVNEVSQFSQPCPYLVKLVLRDFFYSAMFFQATKCGTP